MIVVILTLLMCCYRLLSDVRQEDSLLSSALVGSTATMEDSVGSSQFGSQSDILSVNSLDELDSSRGKDDDEDDPYHGFVPQPNREVGLLHQSLNYSSVQVGVFPK